MSLHVKCVCRSLSIDQIQHSQTGIYIVIRSAVPGAGTGRVKVQTRQRNSYNLALSTPGWQRRTGSPRGMNGPRDTRSWAAWSSEIRRASDIHIVSSRQLVGDDRVMKYLASSNLNEPIRGIIHPSFPSRRKRLKSAAFTDGRKKEKKEKRHKPTNRGGYRTKDKQTD